MCRFALYLGDEIRISSLITEPVNSIIHQSYHSHEREEPLNGDGFGIAWYVDGRDEPAVFKDITPAWNNLNLLNLAAVTKTTCLLAHVRAATPGLPVQQLNCHPFSSGNLSFMHNGSVAGFQIIKRSLLDSLSDDVFTSLQGSTDSEHVFGLILDYVRSAENDPLSAMTGAIRFAIARTEELRQDADIEEPSLLNLALSDGKRAVVSRFVSDHSKLANTLYVHSGCSYVCHGGVCHMTPATDKNQHAVIVASEPLSEDEGWTPVAPNHLVIIDEKLRVTIEQV